jgi:ribonuclease VapC
MILDTSAALAIAFGEPGYEQFVQAVSLALPRRMSAASFLEASMVADSRKRDTGVLLLDSFLRTSAVRIEPVSEQHALIARQCYFDFGKGHHPAGLNFGDCFSYALAKATGEPLLFKGDDFRKTDVIPALP